MADVVPNVGHTLVRCQADGPLKAAERHVVLLGVEAAQAQVVEDLAVIDTHLEQPPEEEGDPKGLVGSVSENTYYPSRFM